MTEETFVRELERHADRVHGAPLSFDDVQSRASSIRRRRRTGAAAAVAAVVATTIVVPTMLTGGSGSSGPEPAPSPPPTAPTRPGTSVLHDGVLTRPDGSTVPLDVDTADVQQFGVLTDGRIVVASSKPYGVQVYAADGELESEHKVAINAITMSADDTLASWLDETSRISVLESGVAEPTRLSALPKFAGSPGSIDAVLGSDCANGGCSVLGGDYTTTTISSTATGNEDLRTSEPLRVKSISPDGERWAVEFPPGDGEQFGCSGLYDPDTDQVVARNCETTLWAFSPDGAHLLGARGDNGMWGSVEFLDSDLNLVHTYEPGADQVKAWGWADPLHLLVVVTGLETQPEWLLLRVRVNGGRVVLVNVGHGGNAEGPSVFQLSQ